MTDSRRPWLLAAMLVADAAWLFVAAGVAGFFAGQAASPLPWPGIVALLLAAMLASGTRARLPLAGGAAELVQSGLGAVAVYTVIAAGGLGTSPGLAWGPRLTMGDYPAIDVLGLVLAVLAGAVVWRTGLAILAERSPLRRVAVHFRLGIVIFALGLVVEQAGEVDLGTAHMLAPFFAASLAGLALARLPRSTGLPASWAGVVATSVLAVVSLGLVLGLTAGVFGRDGVALGLAGLRYLAEGALWVIGALLTTLLETVISVVGWFQDGAAAPGGSGAATNESLWWWERAGLEQGSELVSTLFELVQVAFFVALLYAFWRLLVYAYRESGVLHREIAGENHEPLEGRRDQSADLLALLRSLLPEWVPGARPPFGDWRTSDLAPELAEIFALYFELLMAAVRRGHEFDPAKTPLERVPELLSIVPEAPVEGITSRFNAACYGREPTRPEHVARLRGELEAAIGEHS